MATNEAKPNGQYMIPVGGEQEFLDNKPVGKIPFCGEKTVEFLRSKKIITIYDLRQFSIEALENWMGKHGTYLWQRAHGIDNSEVENGHDQKSMSMERTFHEDLDDIPRLKNILLALTEDLAHDLRGESKLTSTVAVKLRYSDFSTFTKQMHVAPTSNSKILIEKVLRLFDESYQTHNKIRLLGVKFSELKDGNYQINLFDDREKDILLYKAIDELKHKHGTGKITLAQNIK